MCIVAAMKDEKETDKFNTKANGNIAKYLRKINDIRRALMALGLSDPEEMKELTKDLRETSSFEEIQTAADKLIRTSKSVAKDLSNVFTDHLTGLPNRRYFDEEILRAMARVDRNGNRLALAFLDIDDFGKFNKDEGSHIGDLVLRKVAERLKGAVRTVDTATRYGGEEMVVIMELEKDVNVNSVLQRLEKKMCSFTITQDGKSYDLSTSIGVVVADSAKANDLGAEELVKLADARMLEAKKNDKGRMVVKSIEESSPEQGVHCTK